MNGSKSPLAELQADIRAKLAATDSLIAQAKTRVKAAEKELAGLTADRDQLAKVLKAAGGTAAKSRNGAGRARRRLSPEERSKQIVEMIAAAPSGLTKAEIVDSIGLSAIYVQNLLKELRDQNVLRAEPVPGGRGALRWFKR